MEKICCHRFQVLVEHAVYGSGKYFVIAIDFDHRLDVLVGPSEPVQGGTVREEACAPSNTGGIAVHSLEVIFVEGEFCVVSGKMLRCQHLF